MIDILIHGINGKMGNAVYAAAERRKDVNVACGVDKHVFGKFDCPVYSDLSEVNCRVDAVIDFSSPSALPSLIAFAEENGCTLVIATTGHDEKQKLAIAEAAKRIPICFSPNTSRGINSVIKILPELKKLLGGFDITVAEMHGSKKKDKPSGTALALSDVLGGAEIISARGGDIAGIHEIIFTGKNEQITIKHSAFSREVFAEGALDACVKITKMPPALYEVL